MLKIFNLRDNKQEEALKKRSHFGHIGTAQVSITQRHMARRLEISRNTVKKYLGNLELSEEGVRKRGAKKLERINSFRYCR